MLSLSLCDCMDRRQLKRQQKDDIEKPRNEQDEIPDYLKKRKIVQINPQYEDIENAVVSFSEWARKRGMSIIGPMLMELGKREATKHGINNFKASEGWLDKVKKRHGIVEKNLSGEAVAVDKILVKNRMEELPDILNKYGMKTF
ncbi:Tigger transposable element-derived protein 4-like [Oopsacas minuta]|uniref:Tigger transposable element-derived protein 4-like n=1 Tax=Oopsacas minuta TaxID=111878 RepID=A0AAV7JMC8_9METZ|nr:Tigger transposable element-derived protein 4-like [Oopsacas minuta]